MTGVSPIIDPATGLDLDAPFHFGMLVGALSYRAVRQVACHYGRATPTGLERADLWLSHIARTSRGELGRPYPCNSKACQPNGHDLAWWQTSLYTARYHLWTLLEERAPDAEGRLVKLPGFDQVRRNLALQVAYEQNARLKDVQRGFRKEMFALREWLQANTPKQSKAGILHVVES